MRIPLLNIYVMREATFEAVIKDAALKALAHQSKQTSLLLADNHRLARGKPLKGELRFRRRAK